jgi:hypothetical protein
MLALRRRAATDVRYCLGSDFGLFYHSITGQISRKVDEAHQTIGVANKWK